MFSLESSKKRALLYALFFLLNSCQTCHQWEFCKTVTFCPSFNSGRLYFSDENIRGVELELDYGISGLRMYINVFSLEVPSLFDDTNLAQVTVEFNEEMRVYLAPIFLGGQRLLLPDEARDTIIDGFLGGFDVIISTGCYRSVIPPANFQKLYNSLTSIPTK